MPSLIPRRDDAGMGHKLSESTARLREKLARSSVARESMGRWVVLAEGKMSKMTGQVEDK